ARVISSACRAATGCSSAMVRLLERATKGSFLSLIARRSPCYNGPAGRATMPLAGRPLSTAAARRATLSLCPRGCSWGGARPPAEVPMSVVPRPPLFPPGEAAAPAPARPRRPWRRKFGDAYRGLKLGIRGHSSFFVHFFFTALVVAAA